MPVSRASTKSALGSTEPRVPCSSRTATLSSPDCPAALSSPVRTFHLRWTELLRRVFAVDVLTCPPQRRGVSADRDDHRRARRAQDSRPPLGARLATDDGSRQGLSRARVRRVGRNESQLSDSKGVQAAGAVPRAALPARPTASWRPPRGTQGSSTDVERERSTRLRGPYRWGFVLNSYPFLRSSTWSSDPRR